MINCPKCGYDNELGRIFCHSCGTKLDLAQIKPPGQGGKKIRKKGVRAGNILRRVLDVSILVVLGGLIYFLAQVPDVKVPKVSDQEKIDASEKVSNLEQLLTSRKPVALAVTPGEFNAFLSQTSFLRQKGTGMGVSPVSLQAEFDKGTVKLMFVGELTLGPLSKKFYTSYTGEPVANGKEFTFKPVAGRIGGLSVPVGIMETTGLVKNWFGGMLGGLSHEKELLNKVSSIKVTPERALLIHQPPK